MYIIFCDLDGTLLNKKSEISKESEAYIKKIVAAGNLFVIATGRPYAGSIRFYNQLNLNTPMINDNGAHIHHPTDESFGEIITKIPKKQFNQLFQFVKPFTISALFNVRNIVYTYKYDNRLEWLFHGVKNDSIVSEGELDSFNVSTTGVIYLIDKNSGFEFENYINTNLPQIGFRLWYELENGELVYECFLKVNSKGKALKYITDYYQIPEEKVISFGDDLNDIEMIETAYHGVAMKNARSDELKSKTKYQTDQTNEENGVIKYLQKVFNL
jgi:Cof subfamily protein (haloacid dehalogenase superfamily)